METLFDMKAPKRKNLPITSEPQKGLLIDSPFHRARYDRAWERYWKGREARRKQAELIMT